jgi:hypothetical protein
MPVRIWTSVYKRQGLNDIRPCKSTLSTLVHIVDHLSKKVPYHLTCIIFGFRSLVTRINQKWHHQWRQKKCGDNQPEMTPHVERTSLAGFEPTTFGEHDQCSDCWATGVFHRGIARQKHFSSRESCYSPYYKVCTGLTITSGTQQILWHKPANLTRINQKWHKQWHQKKCGDII